MAGANGAAAGPKAYDLGEVSLHRSEKDCWMVIHGKVYDLTNFLDEHPGGFDIVVSNSGKDATEDFEEIGHSKTANEMLKEYYIGDFTGGDLPKKTTTKRTGAVAASPASASMPVALLRAILLPLIVLAIALLYVLR